MPTVHLSIPPYPDQVRTARVVVGAAARRAGVAEEILDEVRLAVGELVTRAVVRHEAVGSRDSVLIALRDDPEMFEVEVRDRVEPGRSLGRPPGGRVAVTHWADLTAGSSSLDASGSPPLDAHEGSSGDSPSIDMALALALALVPLSETDGESVVRLRWPLP